MPIRINIEAENVNEYKTLVKELYVSLYPVKKEAEVQRLPPDPRLHGSNVLKIFDKLKFHIEDGTKVGGCFSTQAACLILGVKSGQIQTALQALKKSGTITMVQKGIWKRVI